jgi:hypothetical protein
MKPCDLVMCPLNFSEGHHYANGGLTSTVLMTFDTELRTRDAVEV